MTQPLYIDNTILVATARCSTIDVTRHGLGLVATEERATLRSGTSVHEALATWFRGGSKEDAMDALANGVPCLTCGETGDREWPEDKKCPSCNGTGRLTPGYEAFAEEYVQVNDRLSWANVSRIMDYWFDLHPMNAFPFKIAPEMVEIGFAFPLEDEMCACGHPHDKHMTEDVHDPNGSRCQWGACLCPEYRPIIFCGRLDAFAALNQTIYTVENKSTGNVSRDWLSQFENDSQNSGYLWAGMQHVAEPVAGSLVNAIELSRIPGSDRKCDRHAVPYIECGHIHNADKHQIVIVTRTPEQIEEWRKTAIKLARQHAELIGRFKTLKNIHKVRMQGAFAGHCRFCAFREWCVAGRNESYALNNFHYEPWMPYDRATVERAHTGMKP